MSRLGDITSCHGEIVSCRSDLSRRSKITYYLTAVTFYPAATTSYLALATCCPAAVTWYLAMAWRLLITPTRDNNLTTHGDLLSHCGEINFYLAVATYCFATLTCYLMTWSIVAATRLSCRSDIVSHHEKQSRCGEITWHFMALLLRAFVLYG